MMKTKNILLLLLPWLLLASCDKLVDFSPFDAITPEKDVNAKNIARITSLELPDDSITFIAISDPHTNYSQLRAAIHSINQMENISFVMVCGDITDWGLYNEYDDYYHLVSRLNIPFITLVGNHDYLANGKTIFKKMFGPTNFYFEVGKYRLVVFDNIVWENGNRSPDFHWLDQAVTAEEEDKTIICCYHISPWDLQLEMGYGNTMKEIIKEHPVAISIFGHGHNYREEIINNQRYMMLPDITKRQLAKITLANSIAHVEMIDF